MKPQIILLPALGLACAGVLAQNLYPVPAYPSPDASTTQFSNGGGAEPRIVEPSPYAYPEPVPPATPYVPEATSGGVRPQTESGAGSEQERTASPSSPSLLPNPLPAPAPMRELAPQADSGYRYLCGGVGENEASLLKSRAREHDLVLTFAARNGAYLADIDVHITDARGTHVLDATCDGPIMLVDVPASGNYRIVARSGGEERSRTVSVRASGKANAQARSVTMVWPSPPAETASLERGNAAPSAGGGPAGHGASGR